MNVPTLNFVRLEIRNPFSIPVLSAKVHTTFNVTPIISLLVPRFLRVPTLDLNLLALQFTPPKCLVLSSVLSPSSVLHSGRATAYAHRVRPRALADVQWLPVPRMHLIAGKRVIHRGWCVLLECIR